MTIDLDKLEALAKAATPGPWRWGRWDSPDGKTDMFKLYATSERSMPVICIVPESAWVTLGSDTEYIAAASPDVVLELVRQLRAANDLVGEIGWAAGANSERVDRLTTRVAELEHMINTPGTDEWFESVRNEAAHQIERWGIEHDAGKRPEDWITLIVYLLGKVSRAHFDRDRAKLLHHIVTVAAVTLNWHRNIEGTSTKMRPGVTP